VADVLFRGGDGRLEMFLGHGGEFLPAGGLVAGDAEVGEGGR
jgi:hypothetical protein